MFVAVLALKDPSIFQPFSFERALRVAGVSH